MNEVTGKALAAELFKMTEVVQIHLPGMSSVYGSCEFRLNEVTSAESSMFSGYTSFSDKWAELRTLFTEIVTNTKTNLDETKDALWECIQEYAETDKVASDELKILIDEGNVGYVAEGENPLLETPEDQEKKLDELTDVDVEEDTGPEIHL